MVTARMRAKVDAMVVVKCIFGDWFVGSGLLWESGEVKLGAGVAVVEDDVE